MKLPTYAEKMNKALIPSSKQLFANYLNSMSKLALRLMTGSEKELDWS